MHTVFRCSRVWKQFGGGSIHEVVPAICVSVLTLIVVSLVTSPPPEDKVAPFFETAE